MNVESFCRCPDCGECDAHRKARELREKKPFVQRRLREIRNHIAASNVSDGIKREWLEAIDSLKELP